MTNITVRGTFQTWESKTSNNEFMSAQLPLADCISAQSLASLRGSAGNGDCRDRIQSQPLQRQSPVSSSQAGYRIWKPMAFAFGLLANSPPKPKRAGHEVTRTVRFDSRHLWAVFYPGKGKAGRLKSGVSFPSRRRARPALGSMMRREGNSFR